MAPAPIRVGIIGSNYGLAHIATMRAAGAAVVALAGRNPEKTAALARQQQIALATTDIDQLCQAVDAVVIASPDGLHHQHVLQVLGHGRHILCEKPLTRTASDAEALVAAAAQTPVVCATAFAYRHISALRQLHHWLRQRPAPRWLSISVANSFASAEGYNQQREGALMGQSGDFGGVSPSVRQSSSVCALKVPGCTAALKSATTFSSLPASRPMIPASSAMLSARCGAKTGGR